MPQSYVLGVDSILTPGDAETNKNKIFNVDFPDVIALREELADTDPRETNIVSDLTNLSWMDQVDARNGAVFYAAGVFHYLKKEDVKAIVLKMTELFPGCRLVFDTVGTLEIGRAHV